jgi:hypothetical protein
MVKYISIRASGYFGFHHISNFITNILQSSSFLRIKQPEREFERSSPSRAEVKNDWNYNSTLLQGDQNVSVQKFARGLFQSHYA